MPKPRLLAEMGQELDSSQSVRMEKALSRLQKGEPVQYVFGKAYFAGLELEVGPGVLIPRPETEELFLWVLDTLQAMAREGNTWRKEMPCRILDLCTGSGALALALALGAALPLLSFPLPLVLLLLAAAFAAGCPALVLASDEVSGSLGSITVAASSLFLEPLALASDLSLDLALVLASLD